MKGTNVNILKQMVRRVFAPEFLIKPEKRLGELPNTRTAYSNMMKIAAPSIAEMVFMSLIGSVDTIMIGGLGKTAISAIGLTAQPRMLIMMIFFALNVGVTAIVARRKGEERQEEARNTLRNAMMLVLIASVLMTALSIVFSEGLVILAAGGGAPKSPEEVEARRLGAAYFRILMSSLPINALALCINASQRGIGKTKITLYVNVVSNVVNVIFNYLLISGQWGFPALGVQGAAIASDLGIIMGALLSLFTVLYRSPKNEGYLYIGLKGPWRFKKDTLVSVVRLGSNAMIEQVGLRFGFFLYSAMIVSLGQTSHAANLICQQFLNMSFCFGDGISVAVTSLVGQNMGRKRADLSAMYGKIAQRYALMIAFVLMTTFITFRVPFTALFLDKGTKDATQVLALAASTMILIGIYQPFQMTNVVLAGCLRGAGDNAYVGTVSSICVGFVRPVMTLLALHLFDASLQLTMAFGLSEILLRMSMMYLRFASGKWTTKKV